MFSPMKKTAKADSNDIRREDAEVGAKFAAAREAAGLTQFDVAIRAGWFKDDNETPNQQRVSHYEVGRRKFSLHDALAYANAIGTDLEAILGLKKHPVKRK
jgi:transcriptional regulator with XRE-family HTH domain